MLAVRLIVLSYRGKYFKGFKPAIARMVTRLEFRLCAGNVLGLTVQLMHIERQEVCYAPALPERAEMRERCAGIKFTTNLEIIMPGTSSIFRHYFSLLRSAKWL